MIDYSLYLSGYNPENNNLTENDLIVSTKDNTFFLQFIKSGIEITRGLPLEDDEAAMRFLRTEFGIGFERYMRFGFEFPNDWDHRLAQKAKLLFERYEAFSSLSKIINVNIVVHFEYKLIIKAFAIVSMISLEDFRDTKQVGAEICMFGIEAVTNKTPTQTLPKAV